MIPPAILNPLVDIPKNLNKNCPEKINTIKVMKETMVARLMIPFRSSLDIPSVIFRKTGIVPKGFVNVKKDVKHNKKKGTNASMACFLI